MYTQLQGDIIKFAKSGKYNVLIHGCNCFHTMGAGVALQIASAFPQALVADKETGYGDRGKLGTISTALWPFPNKKSVAVDDSAFQVDQLIVVNCYTQYYYGKAQKHFNYEALRSCFEQVKSNFSGMSFLYPAIGAGLAKGEWGIIHPIIKEIFHDENHTFVSYNKSR